MRTPRAARDPPSRDRARPDRHPWRHRGTARVQGPAPPNSLALLRALVRANGAVLSRSALADALPAAADHHALEVQMSRLRQTLGVPGLINTIVKRGYRLDV
ncbi:winged helix-turn-helix domain-containing protein [Plantibacter sp. M259]|uniref:winged helix-turn-helix domain-containing protein n=1 Tax=Plantibacter sp. M259 TaxID=2583822 RepID=UPI001F0F290D|nr:winged helix-turn-helix domain-containing protein [Plantibacter sp. M259]